MSDYSAVETVDRILRELLEAKATDVHLDPFSDGLHLRRRINGVLTGYETLPLECAEGIVARLMVLSRLLTYRTDIPQEGRIPPGHLPNADVEFRVSTFPTIRGERCVIRVFRDRSQRLQLADLGFDERGTGILHQWCGQNEGLFLLCGPAGSGKTTTIYAMLAEILKRHGEGVSIVTVEDPVEMELDGVAQTEIRQGGELDFSKALRGLLRQDPEVMVVGEIRDPETAQIAIRAGLTGHQVITTLHASTAVSAFARVYQMGIAPFEVGSSIKGVLSQRLIRKGCSSCDNAGCDDCFQTGYSGRLAIGEFISVDAALAALIIKGEDEVSLLHHVQDNGFVSLHDQIGQLLNDQVTDQKEVFRVFPAYRQ